MFMFFNRRIVDGPDRRRREGIAMRPIELRCEHRRDVPCVDDPAPRLSWTLESSERGKRQSAYQVIVSLENAQPWDSGRVESSTSVDVVYAGRALPPASECRWKVRVWDEAGEPSPWSEPGCFRTGLREWSAQWISRDDADDPGVPVPESESERAGDIMLERCRPAPFLRREFVVEEPVRRAMLYATARGSSSCISTEPGSATPCSRRGGRTIASASSTRRTT